MPSRSAAPFSSSFFTLSGLLLLVFLSGCAAYQARIREQEQEEKIFLRTPLLLIDRLHTTGEKLHTLRGIADIDITSPRESLHARTAVVLQHPGFLRLEAMTPFGQTAMVFTADGQYLSLYAPSERKFFRGSASPDILFTLLHLPVDLSTVTTILRGRVPLGIPVAEHVEVTTPNDRQYRLRIFFPSAEKRVQREVWIAKRTLAPQQYREYTLAGDLKIEVEYDQIQLVNNLYFPFRFMIRFPVEEVTAEIAFHTVKLNAAVTPDLFQLAPPPGVPIIWLLPEARHTP